MYTGEVVEFDIGLRTVSKKICAFRVQVNGLRVEIDGEFEIIIEECFFGLLCEFGRHRQELSEGTHSKRIRNKVLGAIIGDLSRRPQEETGLGFQRTRFELKVNPTKK